MKFKRNESFRFVFEEPLEATYNILIEGKPLEEDQEAVKCKILDISPRGSKIFTELNLSEYSGQLLQLEMKFTLDQSLLTGIGEVVWSKEYGSGYHYGLIFLDQAAVENAIIEDLKSRRRKEIALSKVNAK